MKHRKVDKNKKEIRQNLTEADKKRFTKILLKRYSLGKTSSEENEAVRNIEAGLFDKKKAVISNEMLDRADDRQQKMLSEHLNIEFPVQPRHRPRISPLIIYRTVGIAAAIALLIAIGLPLLKNNEAGKPDSTELVAQAELSQQFVTNGNMKKVTLADGSIVHMNMGSTLSLYKGKFNGHTREVWLDEGEAFFEVMKDKNRPFIVHTPDGLSTRVLGTSFNIKAYRELGEQVVSVKTGRVQVSKEDGDRVVLDPNTKASFDANGGKLTAGMTDGTAAASWRTGNIVMDDADFTEIALRLRQYYNVELVNQAHISPEVKVYFAFTADSRLTDVARALADIYKAHYRINNHQLIIIK